MYNNYVAEQQRLRRMRQQESYLSQEGFNQLSLGPHDILEKPENLYSETDSLKNAKFKFKFQLNSN